MRRRGHLRNAHVVLLLAIMLMGLGTLTSVEAATTDTFSGGITESVLRFEESTSNTSLELELPRGSAVTSAEMVVEGVPVPLNNTSVWDYVTHKFDRDMWTLYMDGMRSYPPAFDPYNTGWAHADQRHITSIKA